MKFSSNWIGKILTLTMVMLFTLSISVFAADNVAKIGTTEYETLIMAIDEAISGDTITLLKDIDLGSVAEDTDDLGNACAINLKGKAITLELDGHVIESSVVYITLAVSADAELTIQDSKNTDGAIITNVDTGEAIRSYGKLTINSGKIGADTAKEVYSLILENGSKTTINDGSFNGVIYTNGSRVNNCELTVNDGTFTSMFYLAGAGEYLIEDGSFSIVDNSSNAIIEIERGELTINGGTFEFNVDTSANSTDTTLEGNGSGNYKGTIVVSRQVGSSAASGEETKLTINAGTYTNNLGDALVTVNKSTDKATLTVNVNDATITGNVSDYGTEKGNDETTLSGGTIVEQNPVAKVNNSEFNTLVEAIEYAESGDTVTLLKDIDLGSVAEDTDDLGNACAINLKGKAITLELDGHVIESSVVYITLAVSADAELTIQDSKNTDGAIITNVDTGEAIRSYGKLTINSGKIGADTAKEVYSLILENGSKTTINDGSFNGVIYTNGSRVNNCELTVNDGTFTSMFYLAGAGEYLIEDGSFSIVDNSSNAIIEIERGELTINGGTFEFNVASAANNASATNNGNASGGYEGTIIVSKGKTTTGGDVSLIVTGGTFTNNSGEAFVMANESTTLTSTIEITDATVTGDIAYYGIKESDSTEPVLTKNNITLKGSTAANNSITVYPNKESKEEVEKGNVKTLQTKIVTITFVLDNGSDSILVSGDYGAEVPAQTEPTKSGYNFVAWNPEIPTTFPSGDMTITATWEKKEEDNTGTNTGNTDNNSGSSSTGGGGGGSSATAKYRITVGQKDGGKISPETLKVEKNNDQKFEIKANEGYKIKDVIVDGKSVGAVSEYTFENVKTTHTITAEFEKIEETTSGDNEWENPYKDVDEKSWYYDAVKFVNSNGLFNGVAADTFAPNTNMTRGMIVTVLYRHAKANVTEKSAFNDVNTEMYYSSPIAWAAANGIVNGIGNNEFAPEAEITREQLVAILYRYAKFIERDVSVGEDTNILSYDDINETSEYAIPAFQWVCGAGIVTGRTESTLAPKGTATRAEVAMMLMRFCK